MGKNFYQLIAICCILASNSADGWAQDNSPERVLPTAPFVVNAPAQCEWEIIYKPKRQKGPEPTDPAELAKFAYINKVKPTRSETKIYKDGDRKAEIKTFANGSKGEVWWKKGVTFSKPEYFIDGDVLTVDNRKGSLQTGYGAYGVDFPELGWLDLTHFKGVGLSPGSDRKSFVYQISGDAQAESEYAAGLPRQANLKFEPITAWIDIETKLPLAMETGEYKISYKFKRLGAMPNPTGDVASAIQKFFPDPF